MSPAQFSKLVDADCRALAERGEQMAQDPPPNAAERRTAAKHDARHRPTPAPWQVYDGQHAPFQVIGDCDVDNHYTAVCDTDSDGANAESMDAANARHIVKCVNSHDALVKALREIQSDAIAGRGTWLEVVERIKCTASAALAKADRA